MPVWTSVFVLWRDRRAKRIVILALASLLVLGLTFASYLWIGYRSEISAAEISTEKLALALDEHTEAAFAAIDGMLHQTASRIEEAEQHGQADVVDQMRILRDVSASLPFLISVSRLDTDGFIIAHSSWTTPQAAIDVSDRDTYRLQRDRPDAGLAVGAPVAGRVLSDQIIVASRRLETPDGRFDGTVNVAVPVAYFLKFFQALHIGEQGLVTLIRSDGVILARDPPDNLLGVSLASYPLFTERLSKAPVGLYRASTRTDGIDRVNAYRTLASYPLVVTVSIAVADALADWYLAVYAYVAVWLAAAAVLSGFTLMLLQQVRRERTAEATIRTSEDARRQSEAHFHAVLEDAVESLDDGFILYDADDRLVIANSKARDWSPEFAAVAVPGARFEDIIRAAAKTGLVTSPTGVDPERLAEERIASRRKSLGQSIERQVGSRWHMIRERQTRDGGVVVLRTDITALKQREADFAAARAEAEDANRAKSEFLATMSHEIRTPMNAVIGFAGLLLDTTLDDEQRSHAETLRDSARALLGLLNDILDYSKIEAGHVEFETSTFAPASVVDGVLSVMCDEAEAKRLALTAEVAPSVPEFLIGDPHRLRQILLNLVNNAIKFTEQGRIDIRVSSAADDGKCVRLRFEVKDTGIGISEDAQAHLFGRFVQADSSITRRFGGTGLGLSICKRLVELMGGSIGVESQIGSGSTFWFTIALPRGEATASVAPRQANAEQGPQLKILLVDDAEMNRRLAALVLKGAGHTVDTANDGAAAVEAVRQNHYDVVLMDVQMPVMDGYEATARIRALDGDRQRIPIVALTANAMTEEIRRCLDAGMNGHIAKPFEKADLLRTVAHWGRAA